MSKFPFSKNSLIQLATTDQSLVTVFHAVSNVIDCTVICGIRTKEEQDEAFRVGASKTRWPDSKHNSAEIGYRSRAVDVAPYPIDWNDRERFVYFAGIVKGVSSALGVKIRWGGDWDGDNDLRDQHFMDLVHFELAEN
jgi:peptidoglycan L-alanyl-D-glutamate endopeptidase CwlK|tara:strand:+ start:5994 stop:6407 length:414 start_codon:yes stop_codon:yes gene_type:complete